MKLTPQPSLKCSGRSLGLAAWPGLRQAVENKDLNAEKCSPTRYVKSQNVVFF